MKHKGTVLIISGAALLVLSLGLFVYNIASDIIAERRASDALSALKDRTGTVEGVDAAGEYSQSRNGYARDHQRRH